MAIEMDRQQLVKLYENIKVAEEKAKTLYLDYKKISDVAHYSLGWMIAKNGSYIDPVIYALAKTLKETGSECTYLDKIISQNLRESG